MISEMLLRWPRPCSGRRHALFASNRFLAWRCARGRDFSAWIGLVPKQFTFLDFDDVPWNNNNAEHAIKAFASVRRVIEGPTTENGLREFLVLLSICETCKCKNVEFLEFLRSGAKDIDEFATSRRGQRVRRVRQRTDRQIEA